MSIQDKAVEAAIETIKDEFENFERMLRERDDLIEELENDKIGLQDEVDNLESQVAELEEAVAEAYLTSDAGE